MSISHSLRSRVHTLAVLATALLAISADAHSSTCRDPERYSARVTVRQLPVDFDTEVPRVVLEAVTGREGAEVGHRIQIGHNLVEGLRSKGPCGPRQEFQVELVALQAQVLVARELQTTACKQSVALNTGVAHMGDVQGLLDRAGYVLRNQLERELRDFSTAWGGDEQSPALLVALVASQTRQVLEPLEAERVQAWLKRIDAPSYKLERARCSLQTREQPVSRPVPVRPMDPGSARGGSAEPSASIAPAEPVVKYRVTTKAD